MSKLTIPVILGSTRDGRYGDKPARWITEQLNANEHISAELLDLRDWPLPFFDQKTPPGAVKDGNYGNALANKWSEKIGAADGFVIVTPEYNHGYPAVLKNALDWLYREWKRKPVGFVAWGQVYGGRVVEQLRLVACELHMVPVRNAVHVTADVWAATKASTSLEGFAPLAKAATHLIDDLVWWGQALKTARQAS